MTNEEFKIKISESFPSATYDETGEWLNVFIEPKDLLPIAEILRNDELFGMDYLFCLTCVDWKTHLTMVYHFTSTTQKHFLVVKSKLDRVNPEIETLCKKWRTAEMLEREVFELFGVKFLHHPDLRNLILPDVWVGYPLRKDYDDPVNMIKL